MKTFLLPFQMVLILLVPFAIHHSNLNAMPTVNQAEPLNLVYVLDLSDRLLAHDQGQAEIDISAIMAGFDLVYKRTQRDFFVKAKHKFKVVAVEQKDANPKIEEALAKCDIDLAQFQPHIRRIELDKFKQELENNLREVYRLANRGQKSSDYPGADIWKFFNDRVKYHLHGDSENQIVVITDGYFDYEPGAATLSDGKRSTCTMAYMKRYRGKADWKTHAEATGCGLLPLHPSGFKFDVLVFGLQAKHSAVNEEQLLMHFWTDWALHSGFNVRFAPNSASPSNLAYLKNCCDIAAR